MYKDSNLEILLKSCNHDTEKPDKDLSRISVFTSLSKLDCIVSNLILSTLIVYHMIKSRKGYYLLKNRKKYHFEKLSDTIEYKADKKTLLNQKEREKDLFRTLKLACSNELINASLVVGTTKLGLEFLIEYESKKEKYIIDYSQNIIMKKSDYNELYNLKEISRMDQATLYKIYFILDDLVKMDINILYLFLFPNEILNNLTNNPECKWINKKYDDNGENKNNYYLLGDSCDCLFFQQEDYQENPIFNKIQNFTENPNIDGGNGFHYDETERKYYYQDRKNKISFELLSDSVASEEIKKQLLSEDRYHECHHNSILLVLGSEINENQKKYLINGKIKINEKDYFYHSWMEVEGKTKTMVFDYNNNLIIDKKDYYKLLGAKEINRTDFESLVKIIKLLEEFEIINFHPMTMGYFSQEIIRDLEKNKFLIKNK